jgi:hypothetical protein
MARALTYTRQIAANPAEFARAAVVIACALALIAAGQTLPF